MELAIEICFGSSYEDWTCVVFEVLAAMFTVITRTDVSEKDLMAAPVSAFVETRKIMRCFVLCQNHPRFDLSVCAVFSGLEVT